MIINLFTGGKTGQYFNWITIGPQIKIMEQKNYLTKQ